ncbi:MAG: molybdopterin-dependent oxidoreductase [Myxococcales bacterium]|nr:molybdopterin-dependent oxidoreductase [Myxococcales bacterium]
MKLDRRTFLIAGGIAGGGMLVGALGVGTYVGTYDQIRAQRRALPSTEGQLVAQWILVEPDGQVRVLSPHTEMGQGAQTSLLQIVLDELDADAATTTIEQAPAATGFTNTDVIVGLMDDLVAPPAWSQAFVQKAAGRLAQLTNLQFTGGSTAIRYTGWLGMRKAAAAARQILAEAGAAALDVPVGDVTTRDGRVHHEASGRSVHFGEIAEAAASLPLPEEPAYKPRSEYRYIGTAFARVDLPDKVFGKPVYGIDVAVPGMRYAAVAPPPTAFARVTGLANRAEIEAMRGVEAVLVLEDCVAVVADKPYRAEWAARKVQVTCDAPKAVKSDQALWDERWQALESGALSTAASRGAGSSPLSGDGVVEARYSVPFLAHTPMEPLNCTVWSEGDVVHVATGVQGPLNARIAAADILSRSVDDVVLHAHTMGGGFGRRNGLIYDSLNWILQACHIHNAVGGAIKLTWSREAELRMSTYRPADAAILSARLGPDGKPSAWYGRIYAPSPLPEEALPLYDIADVTVMSAGADPALPYGYWRSIEASQQIFFIESFVDELAAAAGVEPLAYRRSLISDPRTLRVLDRVAQMADYANRPTGGDRAYGVAMSAAFGSLCAQIVDVSLVEGRPVVHQAWAVIDCGTAVNRGSVETQVQGGIHYGLSAALYGRITRDEAGGIVQSNFHDYRAVTFQDGPRIEVDILDSPDAPVGGVGEVSTPLVAPAVANALAQIGDRPRNLPIVS